MSLASAQDKPVPVVGFFGVNAGLVSVDEPTGRASLSLGLESLPGLAGDGGVGLGLTYAQERVGLGDVFGLGEGWGFAVTRVDVSASVSRVFPASGGAFDAESRSVTEHTEYDAQGRAVRHTDALGAVTTTVYDETLVSASRLPSALVVEQTMTGADGTISKMVNSPSSDHPTVAATETLTGTSDGGVKSTTRSSMVRAQDGFVAEKTVRVSPGADVAEGPSSVTTTYGRMIDTESQTVTVSETHAAGTAAESSVSSVSDLTSGRVLSVTDASGGVTRTGYDDAGRIVEVVDPAGRVERTRYEDHGRTVRVTSPDGVVTSTYRDVLGNVVRTTNNITEDADGSPVVSTDPSFERVTQTRSYSHNGSKVTVVDALGRESVPSRTFSVALCRPRLRTGSRR